MSRRTPEERQRAAEQRAARREGRAGDEATAEHDAIAADGHDPYDGEPVEPLPSARQRSAVADRPPMSRAARAQRVGRPGRPVLPPTAPKPRFRRSFRRILALLALVFIGGALWAINSTFQPLQSEDEEAGAVPVKIPQGADAGSIGELLQA
ncbi:MAG TPA: hypothetical protein VD836_16150, partial [Solirubrobacteraceae bacterium]|nr:hypothetical protein [Solirubrobacteraceae bacterium]